MLCTFFSWNPVYSDVGFRVHMHELAEMRKLAKDHWIYTLMLPISEWSTLKCHAWPSGLRLFMETSEFAFGLLRALSAAGARNQADRNIQRRNRRKRFHQKLGK